MKYLSVMAAFLSCVSFLHAQPLQQATVEKWAQSEIDIAKRLSFSTNIHAKWRYEDYCPLSSADVAELRKEVSGKPDHPRRRELTIVEQQLKEGKIVSHAAGVIQDAGNWRFCWDMAPGMYIDTSVTRRSAWTLSTDALAIYPLDASQVAPGAGGQRSHPRDSYNTFALEVWRLLTGGFGCSAPYTFALQRVEVRGETFEIRLSGNEPKGPVEGFVLLKGRWDDARGAGIISSRTTVGEGGEATATEEIYEGPQWNESLGRFVYTACSQRQVNGRVSRRVVLEEIRPMSAAEFEAYTRTPEVGRDDPVRGTVAVTRVADMSAGTLDRLTKDGEVESTGAIPGIEPRAKRGLLSWLGVGLVCAVVIAVIYMVVLRRVFPR